MVDIPGNSGTGVTVTVGSTTNNTLETSGDHDWFRINLTQGQEITVALNGISLEDPYLRIRDQSGTVIWENDDINIGVNLDSLLSFQATYTGVYFIDVGSWEQLPNFPGGTGDYQLVVTAYQDPPVWTNDQIAEQLVSGYWGDGSHRFNVAPGGQISVNITGLTAQGQALAITALQTWSDIIGITFVQTNSPSAQIMFTDDDPGGGAFTDAEYANGIISSALVNVDAQWLIDFGSDVGDYSFQAYVHEIGHALGLGHAGNYNVTAEYPYSALFLNDAWPATVMSYFSQIESSYYETQGFDHAYVITPMVADIIAMQQLYGLSTSTRPGDTVYGYNSNAGPLYDATVTSGVAFTIFDTGGIDTLDYSGITGSFRGVTLNLNPETFSSVGGRVGVLGIARGTIIENAIGGNLADTLIGNSVANVLTGNGGADTLTGGAGNDTFRGTKADLNGDTITDFSIGDRILITDASLAGFTFSLVGSTLNFTGGSLTLLAPVNGTIIASAAAGGGVQLTIQAAIAQDVRNDFNGDGRSDVLWRSDSGQLTNWLGQPNGGFTDNSSNAGVGVPMSWQVVGTGDFNGDGRDDVLWRNSDGQLTNWLGTANGGYSDNGANGHSTVATSWNVAGVGDFNGDGRDDIVWRNENGTMTNWLGTASGGYTDNSANAAVTIGTSWKIAGVGDFNGDGRDDILWRNDNGDLTNWLGQANGSHTNNPNASTSVATSWYIAGTGDFNGDGRDDILWRNESTGDMTNWLGQANGGFVNNPNASTFVPLSWNIVGVGDFNGDGRDDILWRNDSGDFTNWLGQADGGFVNNPNASTWVPTNWHVQETTDFLF